LWWMCLSLSRCFIRSECFSGAGVWIQFRSSWFLNSEVHRTAVVLTFASLNGKILRLSFFAPNRIRTEKNTPQMTFPQVGEGKTVVRSEVPLLRTRHVQAHSQPVDLGCCCFVPSTSKRQERDRRLVGFF
jgi:hypothetical protein